VEEPVQQLIEIKTSYLYQDLVVVLGWVHGTNELERVVLLHGRRQARTLVFVWYGFFLCYGVVNRTGTSTRIFLARMRQPRRQVCENL
jgi:hypothetical protein